MNKTASKSLGFTLIELVVVIGILGIILAATLALINPVKQIQKAQITQKQSDLEQIKTALDLYYDDNKCYPLSLEFGSAWQEGSITYMSKVPSSSDPQHQYIYETLGDCPQWYVLYAKVKVEATAVSARCPLSQQDCKPPDDTNNHICVYGGIVNCIYISATPLNDSD